MDRRPTLWVADILGPGRREQSWDGVPGAGCLPPVPSDRSREIIDLSMAGLHIRAPARLQLEMNAQDSDEDVLFQQEMRYPERGVGGSANIGQAEREERRASPQVQLLEEPRIPLGSEPAPERGCSLLRRSQEDKFVAGLEEDEAEAGVCNEGSEPVGHGSVRHGLPPDAGRHFGDIRPWVGAVAAKRPPISPRHSASVPLPPREPQGPQSPRRGESMQHPGRGRFDSLPRGHDGGVPRQLQAQTGS
jgi:hypothetical protein